MMKRFLAFAASVLMITSCSETFDATRALQGGMMAAQALSLTDEQVQAYVHQYITQLDAQSKVLPESNAYIGLATSEGNQHTNTNLHLFRQRSWYGIGEETVERQR